MYKKETTQYSGFERKIAFLLTKFPGVKLAIKKIYQRINYIRYKKDYNIKNSYPIKNISLENKESFFGYYDKSPINQTNEYIIFHSSNISTKGLPDPKTAVDIVLYDIQNNTYTIIDKSYSYNWQQGTKMMWVGEYKFIFNIFENGKYKSKIYDIKSEDFKIIDFPIYDTFKDKFAISLSFERLDIGRADYAYQNKNTKINWSDNTNDGLYYIDLENNTKKIILTLQDVIDINNKDTMKDAKHKFNHIMISPNGKKIMFMHRWFVESGRRFDTLFVCNIDGSNLKILADNDMVSHCYWKDSENVVGYLREFDGDKFYNINMKTLEKTVIGDGVINKTGDGHPTIYKDKMIFDTYPNKARILELYIYDIAKKEVEILGEFYQSFDFYDESRCDLHPRFSYDGGKVFFDSVHEGQRQLYMMDIVK